MVPGGNRNKGHDGEREVINLLKPMIDEIVGEGVLRRNLNQSRQGGHDVAGLDFLAIEVKRCETLEIEKWWQQTLRQAEQAGGAIPVLIYRQNRKAWHVVMLGWVGMKMMRVTIGWEDFKEWLGEELRNRVRRGEIGVVSGFAKGATTVVVEGQGKGMATV